MTPCLVIAHLKVTSVSDCMMLFPRCKFCVCVSIPFFHCVSCVSIQWELQLMKRQQEKTRQHIDSQKAEEQKLCTIVADAERIGQ